jgi:hypothetical protein
LLLLLCLLSGDLLGSDKLVLPVSIHISEHFENSQEKQRVHVAGNLEGIGLDGSAFRVRTLRCRRKRSLMLRMSGCRYSDRVGATTDLIAPVNPDFIFPCGDVPALTELLQRALSNPIELARRGLGSLRRMQFWSARENISGVLEASSFTSQRKESGPLTFGISLLFSGATPCSRMLRSIQHGQDRFS